MDLGATHPITGRQWQLTDDEGNALWPDCTIVVPFAGRVSDTTGKVINSSTYKTVQGGWTVEGKIETLELTDLVKNQPVAGVGAVWVAAPDGSDLSALHVLGDDPFSWLTPHVDAPATVSTTSFPMIDQDFGLGSPSTLAGRRRFGELVVSPPPAGAARLLPPLPWLPGRLLHAPGAELAFSLPAGDPVAVDALELVVLLRSREELHHGKWTISDVVPLGANWTLVTLNLPVGAADRVINPWPGLIAWIRYRHAAQTVKTPERITLVPGHYELKMSGTTTGTAPPGHQDSAPVPWGFTQRFWVAHPASLRPYLRFTTVGDNRLFGPRPGFDPTLAGVGFPAHRDYLTAVRFCVPYLQTMFPKLRVRIEYTGGAIVSEDIAIAANAAGESTLPPAAQDWKLAHGGTVAPDDEIEGAAAPVAGPGTLHLQFASPTGEVIELDSWAVHGSVFANAAEQLAWPATCLTRSYDAAGPHDRAPCETLATPSWRKHLGDRVPGVLRMNDSHPAPMALRSGTIASDLWRVDLAGRLLAGIGPIELAVQPTEYAVAPGDWALDSSLASLAAPLDTDAAMRFLQFLHRSGARLDADAAQPALAAVAHPVSSTRLEAICGPDHRLLALWLRTPEPLDWRRVTAKINVRHVTPDTGCPTAYANRRPLPLTADLLPGVDGSGVLLVARFAGTSVELPRGEVTLTLTYAPVTAGLVSLRPRHPLTGGTEKVAVTFIQPLGSPWPLPPTGGDRPGVHLPSDILRELVEMVPPGLPSPGPVEQIGEVQR